MRLVKTFQSRINSSPFPYVSYAFSYKMAPRHDKTFVFLNAVDFKSFWTMTIIISNISVLTQLNSNEAMD